MSPPQSTRASGERRKLHSGVRGEAQAANAFSAYSRLHNASRRKNVLVI